MRVFASEAKINLTNLEIWYFNAIANYLRLYDKFLSRWFQPLFAFVKDAVLDKLLHRGLFTTPHRELTSAAMIKLHASCFNAQEF